MKIDDLRGCEIAEFLKEHIREMKSVSPPESKHALDLEGLRKPEITFWTVWDEGRLIGCGAIKELGADHAEIKSMRTAASYRGKGVASMLLQHILKEAKLRGYRRISLKTGSMPFLIRHAIYMRNTAFGTARLFPHTRKTQTVFSWLGNCKGVNAVTAQTASKRLLIPLTQFTIGGKSERGKQLAWYESN